MGNADIRAIEPAISCDSNPPLDEQQQSSHCQDVTKEVPGRKERCKDNRVVTFQLPQSADGANLGRVGRWYHETLAHRSYIVWLHGVVVRVANVLRTFRSNSRKHDTHRIRPLARISRRRWHQTTLDSETQLLKSCWPVPQTERLFLPTFPVDERRSERYVERSHLADGAFGRVYVVQGACDNTTVDAIPHRYALKILQKSNIILSHSAGQVRDEVKIQTICGHHPFIVPCIDYWQNRTSIFLLCEFYSNGELFHRLKSFTVQLVQLYVAELALALDFLHNAGIIYRDLKPENILLDDQFHIKLTDFGLSKWLSIGDRTTTLCGTIQYMAPEILQGEPYGHTVDWWALGVLACRMYTGRYPNMDPAEYLRATAAGLDTHPATAARTSAYAPTAINTSRVKRLLPESVDRLVPEGRDLLQRLLQPDPKVRLRSLLQLQRIALYQHYRWDDVRQMKILPRDLFDEECLTEMEDISFPEF
ncbi:serine/threonine-protein kinase S6KL [Anopheles moucheti]|uniref:serine/threonine-protein kinase S6KL n=1 Tax=Anopheles moucheti TaxID=186751 RepID=UPI0022F0C576|nr:serine/threonine-protein kinase S6KL [Anopheles moucheti]XP_052901314.1 serine/threonine-protein kinase S6KL [Anopheles moucheti]XP_052901315.1 serine/threonine-protein kinase S6KL [Anopheles moucheti]